MAPIASASTAEPLGAWVELDGETYSRITNVDRMPPFLMTVASDTDLWMFLASTGGLTAGRTDPDGALFPYDNVDRLYDAHLHTGPITLLRVRSRGREALWEPLSGRPAEAFRIERRLWKNVPGNRVVFEELHHDLGLAFRYRWSSCEAFGFVRTARLESTGQDPVRVEVLDGLRNVLAFGAPLALYQRQSSLVDAYRRSELDATSGLAIYSLTTKITDRPVAEEVLRANVVWHAGLEGARTSLDLDALEAFRTGQPIAPRTLLTGSRGHYLVHATVDLSAGSAVEWHMAADAGLGPVEIVALRSRLREGSTVPAITAALDEATEGLVRRVAAADGLQCTASQTGPAHHFVDVLFNIMRGGVFADGYGAPRRDVLDFLRVRSPAIAGRHADRLAALPERVDVPTLIEEARATGDPDLERLLLEYLPLTFGRRHGDPSRPWNRFSIRTRDRHGAPALYYEGNWRDIFQNWEALATGYPHFLPGMIARFLNASTVDGFNPYRITRDGVDWEVVDPNDPESHIGYWGDHPIVYLLRLLEALHRFAPGTLLDLLDRRVFSYADVPYRIRPYAAILANPHESVEFDAALNEAITRRVRAGGTDGQLVTHPDGSVRLACLAEKLLVAVLARLSNYVAGGGIWMNTQRPEWNDANNALAGWGVSAVTLCHLGRFLRFLDRLLAARGGSPVAIDAGVAAWAGAIRGVLEHHEPERAREPHARRALLDALGAAYETYRGRAYAGGPREEVAVDADSMRALCRAALAHVDRGIADNRRPDGLRHAYHVMGKAADGGLVLDPLDLMLEGQVAALASDSLPPAEAADLVEALFESPLHDPGRRSFMLQPDRELPAFLEKNVLPAGHVRSIGLLRDMVAVGESTLVVRDAEGTYRFHPDLTRSREVEDRLDLLAGQAAWKDRVARDREAVLTLHEAVFRHRAFTGRSGRMYAYEGIGCIYWHMVGKLLLAVQEQARCAVRSGDSAAGRLIHAFDRIRSGLGVGKSPAEFGAFPTDPYSHTPRDGGARQPGMTGQVKEEILVRMIELGVEVDAGVVAFRPWMVDVAEFLTAPRPWRVRDVADGAAREIEVPAGALGFTWCGAPVLYHLDREGPWIRVERRDGSATRTPGDVLDEDSARLLLARRGEIARIDVGIDGRALAAR